MILGLSVHTFTVIHVLISLVGIVAGVIVAFAMVQGKSVPGWTALALLALILTSVTGFFFHNTTFTPAQGVGVISLVVLAVAVIALYFLHLTGIWRWIYVIAAMVAIYLNVFVGVIQRSRKSVSWRRWRRTRRNRHSSSPRSSCWQSSSCSVLGRCESSIRAPHDLDNRIALAGRSNHGDHRHIHEA
jgi:hypothetical protein